MNLMTKEQEAMAREACRLALDRGYLHVEGALSHLPIALDSLVWWRDAAIALATNVSADNASNSVFWSQQILSAAAKCEGEQP